MNKKCTCRICQLSKSINALILKYKMDKKDSFLLIDTFWANLEDIQTERDNLRSILNGTWPHAKERLQYALSKLEKS